MIIIKKFNIISLFLLILPINAYAFSFECDTLEYRHKDTFYCRLNTPIKEEFSSITGSINTSNLVTCNIVSLGSGLDVITASKNNLDFNYTGTPTDKEVLMVECKVSTDLKENKEEILEIPNLKYKLTSDNKEITKYIKSTPVKLIKDFMNTNTTTQNVSNSTIINKSTYLSSIYCPDFNINFSKYILNYDLEVLNKVESLNIQTKTEEANIPVKIEGNKDLKVGNNTVTITVGDAVNSTVYTLNVKRLEANRDIYNKESDATLFNLNVVGYNIMFKPKTYDYTLPLAANVASVIVEADPNNKEATFQINYPEKIENNSKITIKVISQDRQHEQTYTITIDKPTVVSSHKYYYIAGIVVVLVIILIILLKIIKRNNEKDRILGLKSKKRVLNYGTNFNIEQVPDIDK